MLALSIRQSWASLIIKCGKDIENRTWPTRYRGRILVHAAKGMTRDDHERVNSEFSECSHISCPHRRSAWSERPQPVFKGPWPKRDCKDPEQLDKVRHKLLPTNPSTKEQ